MTYVAIIPAGELVDPQLSALCDWARANDIDPGRTSSLHPIEVHQPHIDSTEAATIHFRAYVFDERDSIGILHPVDRSQEYFYVDYRTDQTAYRYARYDMAFTAPTSVPMRQLLPAPATFPIQWWMTQDEFSRQGPERDRHQGVCLDCGVDFGHGPRGLGEGYMVTDEVWAASGLAPDGGTLCIGCLETRIGRQLRRDDFAEHMRRGTARLDSRLAQEACA